MKSAFVIGGLLAVFVAGNSAIYFAGTATAHSVEEAKPVPETEPIGPLVAEPAEIDLGDLKIRESRDFSVRLRNTGKETIKLAEVSAGCSCTDVVAEKMELVPGGETVVRGRFKGKSAEGPFQVALRVTPEGAERSRLSVPITGTIRSRFPLSAKEVVLAPSLVEGTVGTGTVTVRNESAAAVELTPGRLPEGTELRINDASIAPGESASLMLTADADLVMEREISLSIGTGHSDEPQINLMVQLRPESPVSVTPEALRLGVLTREDFLELEPFVLTLRTTGDLRVLDVNTPAFLCAGPVRRTDPGIFGFELVPAADQLGIDLRGEIEIDCRLELSGSEFVVRVPVSGFLRN